jgi:outer membrane immunogenic protein
MHRIVRVLVAAAAICGTSWSASARNDTIMQVADTPFQWAGLYFGVQGGAAWGDYKYCDAAGANCTDPLQFKQPTFDFSNFPESISGLTAGGLVGANVQLGAFIIGVEGDANWIALRGRDACSGAFPPTCNTDMDYFATARARVGLAAGNVMLYGTGGWAWANMTSNFDDGGGNTLKQSVLLQGYTFGGGVEALFANGWGMRGEWLYTQLLSGDLPGDSNFAATSLSSNFQTTRVAFIKHLGAN